MLDTNKLDEQPKYICNHTPENIGENSCDGRAYKELGDMNMCQYDEVCRRARASYIPQSDQQKLRDEWNETEVSAYLPNLADKEVLNFWLEKINQQQKDFDARVERFIKEAEAMKGYISNLAPDDKHHTVENYNIGIADTVALAKQMLQGNK